MHLNISKTKVLSKRGSSVTRLNIAHAQKRSNCSICRLVYILLTIGAAPLNHCYTTTRYNNHLNPTEDIEIKFRVSPKYLKRCSITSRNWTKFVRRIFIEKNKKSISENSCIREFEKISYRSVTIFQARSDYGATRNPRDGNKVLRVQTRLIKFVRAKSEGTSTYLRQKLYLRGKGV